MPQELSSDSGCSVELDAVAKGKRKQTEDNVAEPSSPLGAPTGRNVVVDPAGSNQQLPAFLWRCLSACNDAGTCSCTPPPAAEEEGNFQVHLITLMAGHFGPTGFPCE